MPRISKPQTRLATVPGLFMQIVFATFLVLAAYDYILFLGLRFAPCSALLAMTASGIPYPAFILFLAFCIVLHPRSSNDIRKAPTRRYIRSSTCSFNHQWLLAVTIGIKKNYIIFSIEIIKIVLRIYML